MADTTPTAMSETERDAFLGTGGTGVLSFPRPDGAPHALPVSYGYDADGESFYFRLAVPSDSEKAGLLDRPVSFVVHGETETGWHSVIATGRLEETTDEAVATETLQGLRNVRIPLVDIFGSPPGDVPFQFYRLAPEELTARKETSTAA
jgi:nitroimidazol reductase NimA-like FMN-containing flavoprotein (pyridoxamine 5'-phosphate oxidase superfamily)